MLTKEIALKLFEAFSIERWNDLVRPFELNEMDKSAEKMVLAYIIGKYEENRGGEVDWDWIIHASLFDLLRKIALCDIKSPVQRMIRSKYPSEYKKLNEWVIGQYEELLKNTGLIEAFRDYLFNEKPDSFLSKRILRCAHKYSAMREFEMISVVNEPFRVNHIQQALLKDIEVYLDLRGLQLLIAKQKPYQFLMIIEQLRFQTRWNQTPRIPKTSVLGHSLYVALLTFFISKGILSMHPKRLYNNFFSALFHDLPEAVTRDIISPVKQATEGLPSIVKEIEEDVLQSDLVPLMEDFYVDELLYFTSDEFSNRIAIDSRLKKTQKLSFEEINTLHNKADTTAIDGELVRLADHAAAFIEADRSIKFGISSEQLKEGRDNIRSLYPAGKILSAFPIGDFYAQFL